jgi:hypothetical protein
VRLAFGVWRLAFGVWRLAFGVRRSAFGVRRIAVSPYRRIAHTPPLRPCPGQKPG